MRDQGRGTGCFSTTCKVIGEISAERSDSHGAAVPHRTLAAKRIGRHIPPFRSGIDFAQLNPGHAAVTAIWITLEAPGKTSCQRILIEFPV